MNVFYNTIVFVKDINVSKAFYSCIIGLKIELEYETVVFFENHFVIHDYSNIMSNIFGGNDQPFEKQGNQNLLIYFETDDIEKSFDQMVQNNITIINPVKQQEWGQKVFRIYDPDNHIIEIGEAMHLDYLKKSKS